jgi:hypothetical protein
VVNSTPHCYAFKDGLHQRASSPAQLENPFYHRTSIKDQRFFFGRTAETRKVLSYVAMRQPVSIVGPRRIGKSSLLFHLCDPQIKAAHGLGDDHVFVYIDCEVLSEDLTKSDVYRMLLEETAELAQGDCSAEYGSREPMTYLDFERCLDDITAPGRQIVFLFDEFESIADNRRLGRDFFEELRGLGQTGQVVYVTASGETLSDLSFHDETILGSPFFNIFSTVWLGFMKPHEARALVDGLAATAGFEGFDEDDHAFLQEIAGPYPFYLQVACYLLFEEKTGKARSTGPDYDLVRSGFAREMQGHFRHTWTRLSNDEQKAFKLIGEGRQERVSSEDMERLEQKCLVYQGQIFSSALAEYIGGTQSPHRAVHSAWRTSGLLLCLVLLLGALLVWQAPDFVYHSVLSIWNAANALWNALGQIGDATSGLIVIVLVLSIAVAGIKGRKQISHMLHELWERLT